MKKNNSIRLTETELKQLIKESVKTVLNCNLIKENIEYNGNSDFVLFGDELDYSSVPELENFFKDMLSEIEENYEIMDIDITVYYDTDRGRPGNYGTYEEPIPPSYTITDYDYTINDNLKNMMGEEIFSLFNEFIDNYISDNIYEMTTELENNDPDGII